MQSQPLTVNQAAALYAEVAVTLKSHSWRTWSRAFCKLWGERELASITTGDINTFIASRRLEGIGEATIRSQLMTLKQLFNTAEDRGFDVRYPRRVARTKVNNDRVRDFNDDEEERLKRVMHAGDWQIVELAFSTGLRGAELWELKCSEVDLARSFLLVRCGKGGKSRRVPLGKTAVRVLSEMIATARTEYVVNPPGLSGKSRASLLHRWKERRWRPAVHSAEIENFNVHDLRHSFASRVVRQGKSLYQLQRVMGHASPCQTARYAHLQEKDLLDVVAEI